MQADEKARLEEQARENADAAAAAHNTLKEAEASKLKAAENATAAWDSTALRKHVRQHPQFAAQAAGSTIF